MLFAEMGSICGHRTPLPFMGETGISSSSLLCGDFPLMAGSAAFVVTFPPRDEGATPKDAAESKMTYDNQSSSI
jgi:hypothetical protein